jgi:hypothetical protein
VQVYFAWPLISHLGDLSRETGGFGMGTTVVFGALALQLTVPLVTLFAANRSAVPSATARYAS